MQYFESAACCSEGRATRGSSSPNTTAPGRSRASSPTCGSWPGHPPGRAAAAPQAGRSRRGRSSTAACPARWCRRRPRQDERADQPLAQLRPRRREGGEGAKQREAIPGELIPQTGELPLSYRRRVKKPGDCLSTLRSVDCGERSGVRSGGRRQEGRASALWGSGKRGSGSRSNALWGSGKRRTALLTTLALSLIVPLGAAAGPSHKTAQAQAFVAPSLLSAAQADAGKTFSVIVQGRGGNQGARAVATVLGISLKSARTFSSIDGVAVDLTGAQILKLAGDQHVAAITSDARVRLAAAATSNDKWPFVT